MSGWVILPPPMPPAVRRVHNLISPGQPVYLLPLLQARQSLILDTLSLWHASGPENDPDHDLRLRLVNRSTVLAQRMTGADYIIALMAGAAACAQLSYRHKRHSGK